MGCIILYLWESTSPTVHDLSDINDQIEGIQNSKTIYINACIP